MSYNIGQIRYVPPVDPAVEQEKWKDFLTEVNYKETSLESLKDEDMVPFYNFALDVTGEDPLNPGMLTPAEHYYLHFRIYKRPAHQETDKQIDLLSGEEIDGTGVIDNGVQKFQLKLRKKNSTEIDITQNVKSYTISAGPADEYVDYEIIIAPDSDYQYVLFFLERTAYDYQVINPRQLNIEIIDFASIKNVASDIFAKLGITTFSKIGIQSAPGTLMCINGEEIRVGRSGIYEINNGIPVSFIGFASTRMGLNNLEQHPRINFFILDYAYETL